MTPLGWLGQNSKMWLKNVTPLQSLTPKYRPSRRLFRSGPLLLLALVIRCTDPGQTTSPDFIINEDNHPTTNTIEPQREKTYLLTCAPNEDQPARPRRLIWAFIVCTRKQHFWLSKMYPEEILIRLREYAGWPESSLGAPIGRYVFWRCGSICYHVAGGCFYLIKLI